MKKIYTFIFCFMLAVGAQAQKNMQRDIQGKWKLVSYQDEQVYIDAEKGTYVLDEGFKGMLSPDDLKEADHDYKIMTAQYKNATLEFKGDQAVQIIGTETYGGTFTLETAGGETVLTISTTEDTEEEAVITIEKGLLRVTIDDTMDLVYKRV